MFDKATRLKLRFPSIVGNLSVEDLWDLPLTSTVKKPNLDDIAIELNKELKETSTESFVKKTNKANEIVKLKFDIVLEIIKVRQSEAEAAEVKRASAEKKSRIMEIMAQKQDESLKSKSIEELQALVRDL